MKILLFTHKIDIDGLGCAVLANLAFDNVEIVYCDTFEINQKVQKYINSNKINNFDMIFVTDLCIKQPLIDEISNDIILSEKLLILDHHKSEIEEGNGDYEFSHIVVADEKGKCCGTSLFYEYLTTNKFLRKSENLDYFVELTRQYDTWEWKTIYNNEESSNLNIVFSIFGREKYIELMTAKMNNNEQLFDNNLTYQIIQYKEKIEIACLKYINEMWIVKLNNLSVGVIDNVDDVFKNDIAEMLKSRFSEKNIDLVAMLINKRDTVSFRNVNTSNDLGKLASEFGGKGHKEASSCPQNDKILSCLKK